MFAQSNTTDEGVVINGVKWATRNLDVGGTFVENQEDSGALFQWGRRADGHEIRTYVFSTTTLADSDIPGHANFICAPSYPCDWRSPQNYALWNAGTESAPVKSANDPSPSGWRVPTATEIDKLLDETKVGREYVENSENKFIGIKFTDKDNTDNSVFFPITDVIRHHNESTGFNSSSGYYFTSTPSDIYARCLGFNSSGAEVGDLARACGRSVRPIADNTNTSINEVSTDTENAVVTGYFDILGRKLNEEPTQGFYIIRYSNGTSKKIIR